MLGWTPALFALTTIFAASPQEAVRDIFGGPHNAHVAIERTNVAGRFATVMTHGAIMEGSAVNAPILVERFAFGWQALELVNSPCELAVHALPADVKRLLIRGMPVPKNDRPCSQVERGNGEDVGPPADIAAVRLQMYGPLVPRVVVVGDFALGSWYGAGGGQQLFHKSNGRWQFEAGGGGAMGTDLMGTYGVPRKDWCAFSIYDAGCAKRR
jgi:hypothetical protein